MSITFTSHVKHRLGSWLLGTPQSMCSTDEDDFVFDVTDDFYFEKSDRQKPKADEIGKPDVYMSRMATAWFRIVHTHRSNLLESWILTVALVVLFGVFGIFGGIHSMWQADEQKAKTEQAATDTQIQTHCNALTTDQQKADSACTDLAARQLAKRKADQKAYWEKACSEMPADNRARSPFCNGHLPEIQ